jgi:outer membrane protein assembly factor BamB
MRCSWVLLHSIIILSLSLSAVEACRDAAAADWPQWCGSDGKNMVSAEKGLPDSFVPGKKRADGTIDLATARHVRWGVRVGDALYSAPAIFHGRVFIGGQESGEGTFTCLDEATGKILWRWRAPLRKAPRKIAGFDIGVYHIPAEIGVCSSPAVEDHRVWFVSHAFDVLCLDVRGETSGLAAGKARVLWSLDMWNSLGVFPCDAANGSPVIDGDVLYVPTSNGIDRSSFQEPARERYRKVPAPKAPNLIAINKRTGRLLAVDDAPIVENILHGQWSSPSLGTVAGRKLVFYGGGDGRCYAFEALGPKGTGIAANGVSPPSAASAGRVGRLRTVWSCDCIPAEYKDTAGMEPVLRYCLGDRRVRGTLNKSDGSFVGSSEIIATPVFFDGRVYVAIGRDPAHGRGRGVLLCIDAAGAGDVTKTGKMWIYQGLERSLSTVSIADGLLYVIDRGGRLHCLDARTGKCHWIHDTSCEVWGSTLVADGKIYMPTSRGLWVLAAGKTLKVLSRINLGARVLDSPVAANGTLYVATAGGWLWAVSGLTATPVIREPVHGH